MAEIPKPFIPPPPAPPAPRRTRVETPEPALPWWRRAWEWYRRPDETLNLDPLDVSTEAFSETVSGVFFALLPIAGGLLLGAGLWWAGAVIDTALKAASLFPSVSWYAKGIPTSPGDLLGEVIDAFSGLFVLRISFIAPLLWLRSSGEQLNPFIWTPLALCVPGWCVLFGSGRPVTASVLMLFTTAALAFAAWAFAWFSRRGVSGWQVLADPHKALQEAGWEKRRELNAEDQPESLD